MSYWSGGGNGSSYDQWQAAPQQQHYSDQQQYQQPQQPAHVAAAPIAADHGWEAQPADPAVNQAGSVATFANMAARIHALIDAARITVPPAWRKALADPSPTSLFDLNLAPAVEEPAVQRYTNRLIVSLQQYAEYEPETYIGSFLQMLLDHVQYAVATQKGLSDMSAVTSPPPIVSLRMVKMGTKLSQVVVTFNDKEIPTLMASSLRQVGFATEFADARAVAPSTVLMFFDAQRAMNDGAGLQEADVEQILRPGSGCVVPGYDDGVFYTVFTRADDVHSLFVSGGGEAGGALQNSTFKTFGVFFCVAEVENENLVEVAPPPPPPSQSRVPETRLQLQPPPPPEPRYAGFQPSRGRGRFMQPPHQPQRRYDASGWEIIEEEPEAPLAAPEEDPALIAAMEEADAAYVDPAMEPLNNFEGPFVAPTMNDMGSNAAAASVLDEDFGLYGNATAADQIGAAIADDLEIEFDDEGMIVDVKSAAMRAAEAAEKAAAAEAMRKQQEALAVAAANGGPASGAPVPAAKFEESFGLWDVPTSHHAPTIQAPVFTAHPAPLFGVNAPHHNFLGYGGVLAQPVHPANVGVPFTPAVSVAVVANTTVSARRPASPLPTPQAEDFVVRCENTIEPKEVLKFYLSNLGHVNLGLCGEHRNRVAAVICREECFSLFVREQRAFSTLPRLIVSEAMISGLAKYIVAEPLLTRDERVARIVGASIAVLTAEESRPLLEKLVGHADFLQACAMDPVRRRNLVIILRQLRQDDERAKMVMRVVATTLPAFLKQMCDGPREAEASAVCALEVVANSGCFNAGDLFSAFTNSPMASLMSSEQQVRLLHKFTRHMTLSAAEGIQAELAAMLRDPVLDFLRAREGLVQQPPAGAEGRAPKPLTLEQWRPVLEALPRDLLREIAGRGDVPENNAVSALAARLAASAEPKAPQASLDSVATSLLNPATSVLSPAPNAPLLPAPSTGPSHSVNRQQQPTQAAPSQPSAPSTSGFRMLNTTQLHPSEAPATTAATAQSDAASAGSKRKRKTAYDELVERGVLDFSAYTFSSGPAGLPFPPLPARWEWRVSYSSGNFYFVSPSGTKTYEHPTTKTEYRAPPQAFVRDHRRTLPEQKQWVLQLSPEIAVRDAERWVASPTTRHPLIDELVIEKLRIEYAVGKSSTKPKQQSSAGVAATAAASAPVTAVPLANPNAWAAVIETYPPAGPPFPVTDAKGDAVKWHLSTSNGLYYFDTVPSGTSYKHPSTGQEYLPSPQTYFMFKVGGPTADLEKAIAGFLDRQKRKADAENKSLSFDAADVRAWLADQRIRNTAIDDAVVAELRIKYPKVAAAAAAPGAETTTAATGASKRHNDDDDDRARRRTRHR